MKKDEQNLKPTPKKKTMQADRKAKMVGQNRGSRRVRPANKKPEKGYLEERGYRQKNKKSPMAKTNEADQKKKKDERNLKLMPKKKMKEADSKTKKDELQQEPRRSGNPVVREPKAMAQLQVMRKRQARAKPEEKPK
jgi:hypothetical protein